MLDIINIVVVTDDWNNFCTAIHMRFQIDSVQYRAIIDRSLFLKAE